jgi:AcrR family transcriptional regulator
MQKPKTAAAIDRVTEITAVARRLVAEEGAGALSMREVAKRIGMTLTALQYHVPTKAALVELLVTDAQQRYREALAPFVADGNEPPDATLSRVVAWLLEPDADWDEHVRFEVQLWSMAFTDTNAGRALDAYLGAYRAFLTKLILRINPALAPTDADTRAAAIAAMLEGAILFSGPGRPDHADAGALRQRIARAALLIAKDQ